MGGVVHTGPYTLVFASPLPAEPAQAAVVEGFREGQVLWGESEVAQHLVPLTHGYVTGHALTVLATSVKLGKAGQLVSAGINRFFKTRVTAITESDATVATCDDGSEYKEENPDTGEVNARFVPTPGGAYLFETWRMVRLRGHWAIGGFTAAKLPSRSAEACQPGMTGPGPSRRPDVTVLLRQMTAVVQAASSVHLRGTVQHGGKTLGVNLSVARSGGLFGQVSENGAAFGVLVTHGHSYLKLSAAFLRVAHLPATACSRICGRYVNYHGAQSHELLPGLTMASVAHSLISRPARDVKLLGAVTVAGELA